MARPTNIRAITTRDSIANLWSLAESQGEVTIYVADERAAYLTRNKLYAHRTRLRRQSMAHVGIEASHLDGFGFAYGLLNPDDPTGKWYLTITYDIIIEFELVVPEGLSPDQLPHFDRSHEDPPQTPTEEFPDDHSPF